MERQILIWALLLAIPPGIGVVGFVTIVTGGGVIEPMGVLIGGVVALAIFALVVVGASGERPEGEPVVESES